ncbi:MAG: hypothetical protein Tsb0013_07090 [Phycisphaerales bacterium]
MRRTLTLGALALMTCSTCALAQVDDAALEQMMKTYDERREALFADRPDDMLGTLQTMTGEVFAGLEIEQMNLEQLADLAGSNAMGFLPREHAETVLKRFAELARSEEVSDEDRALAAALGSSFDTTGMYYMEYTAPEWAMETQRALHSAFLASPARARVLRGDHAMAGIEAMMASPDGSDVPTDRVVAIMDAIGTNYPVEAVSGPAMLWDTVTRMADRDEAPLTRDERERARLFCIAWAEAGERHHRAKIDAGDDEEMTGRIADYFASTVDNLSSRAARGLLIGYPAPELSIQWCSDENVTSLKDLEGKVVVLDFFATWCGPCIASFPNVRDLREMYPEEHVAIVMITSPQGSVYNLENTPIDCEGDVEKEIELMTPFMEHHDISWTMAMLGGEDEVFHPDFGVRGIPHVAIIDAQGKVRYNGLHPMDEGKAEKINGLLKEAGLPVPAPSEG